MTEPTDPCRICNHGEGVHRRRRASKRHGFSTNRACALCACVDYVMPAQPAQQNRSE